MLTVLWGCIYCVKTRSREKSRKSALSRQPSFGECSMRSVAAERLGRPIAGRSRLPRRPALSPRSSTASNSSPALPPDTSAASPPQRARGYHRRSSAIHSVSVLPFFFSSSLLPSRPRRLLHPCSSLRRRRRRAHPGHAVVSTPSDAAGARCCDDDDAHIHCLFCPDLTSFIHFTAFTTTLLLLPLCRCCFLFHWRLFDMI